MPRGIPGSGASRMGKPTNLDENIIRQFCALARLGLGKTVISSRMGIGTRTVMDWFEKGKKHLNRKPGSKGVPNGEIYATLVVEWKKACATAEADAVQGILTAGQRTWQALAWWLERTRPQRWADRGPMLRALDKEFAKLVEDTRKAAGGGTGETPPDVAGD